MTPSSEWNVSFRSNCNRIERSVPLLSFDMSDRVAPRLDGRRAQAARNDGLILEDSRQVFTKDPQAPISTVAGRAGVGIGALYRRYGNKQGLLRALCADGLQRYVSEVEAALTTRASRASFFRTSCAALSMPTPTR